MNVNDFLTLITQGFFILLGIVIAADYLRHRDATRRDVALMVWSLALLFLLQIVTRISGETPPRWANILGLGALLAQPYLLLRIVRYIRPTPSRVMQIAFAAMIASWAAIIFISPLPSLVTLLLIAYFAGFNGYAMLEFVRGALRTSGVVRQRLRLAAAGSGLLALVLLLLGAVLLVPSLQGIASVLVLLGVIGAGISYYLGFAPPRWLRRTWQYIEMNRHLTAINDKPADERLNLEKSMSDLMRSAIQAVGGMSAGIAELDEASQQWNLRYTTDELGQLPLDNDGAVGQTWKTKKPTYVRNTAGLNVSDRKLLDAASADTLIVVPIRSRERTWGLLLLFLRYGSLFIEDDLNFLTLLVNQSAIFLENNSLVEQLRVYSEGLEQEVEAGSEALKASEGRYQLTLDNMLEGCQIISFDWRYLYVNESAARYGRTTREGLLGSTVTEKYPGIERSPMYAAMKRCMDERVVRIEEFEFIYPDGSKAWFEFSIQPVPEGIFILSLDITERKLAEQALQRSNEELEIRVAERTQQLQAANKELEAFSYSVSHDLRAPLRAIDGFSQALEEDFADRLDADGKGYIERIRSGSQRMGQLIDDLLELSRLTRSEMRREPVDLSAMARRIAAELQEQYPERKVDFTVADGLTTEGDARLLRVALSNLLNNAWKYTGKQAEPHVEFGATTHNGRDAYYVRDNGAGFDMSYADKLFGVFQRLHRMNDFPGNGVGLATVQRIIHRHGGEIWAEAAVNCGATFYFSL